MLDERLGRHEAGLRDVGPDGPHIVRAHGAHAKQLAENRRRRGCNNRPLNSVPVLNQGMIRRGVLLREGGPHSPHIAIRHGRRGREFVLRFLVWTADQIEVRRARLSLSYSWRQQSADEGNGVKRRQNRSRDTMLVHDRSLLASSGVGQLRSSLTISAPTIRCEELPVRVAQWWMDPLMTPGRSISGASDGACSADTLDAFGGSIMICPFIRE